MKIINGLKKMMNYEGKMSSNSKLEMALRYLDEKKVIHLINEGFSIKEYERTNPSTLVIAILSFERLVYSHIYKEDSNNMKKLWKYYCDTEKSDLVDLEVNFKTINKYFCEKLLVILELLYKNGANINQDYFEISELSSFMSSLLEGVIKKGTFTPIEVFLDRLDEIKSEEIVDWFFSKDDLIIPAKNRKGKSILDGVIQSSNMISCKVLARVLERGIELEENAIHNIYEFLNDGQFSSLDTCYMKCKNNTREEKLSILYNYTTEEQRKNFENSIYSEGHRK